jgi:uncharacterized membrane protein
MTDVITIARGDASRIEDPRRIVARTEDEWRALWAVHAGPDAPAPAVDLSRVVVAAAFAGEKPSAGYGIEISAADHADHPEDPRGVRLVVEQRGPGRDVVAASIITSPFHIVAVPRSAGEIWWEEAGLPAAALAKAGGPGSEAGGRRLEAGNPSPSSTGLTPRTASALAYLAGPFSGALILLAESTNEDVRFHAWQSIVGLGGLGLAVAASYVLAFVALFLSATAASLMVAVAMVIWIVLALVWAICLWKAWSGERWKLPLAGDYAERHISARTTF